MKFVGTFNEKQVIAKEDKKAVEKMQTNFPQYKYVKTKFVKKGGKIIGMNIYLMTTEEYLTFGD